VVLTTCLSGFFKAMTIVFSMTTPFWKASEESAPPLWTRCPVRNSLAGFAACGVDRLVDSPEDRAVA
jgi:hypothetical protein